MKKMIVMLAVLSAVAFAPAFAPGQDYITKRLDKSPRHHEWTKIKQGKRNVETFIVYPEVKDKATAVVIIHEIFGLSDWMRGMADQLAEAGYIAIAPDFLSGTGPGGGGTKAYKAQGDITKAVQQLPAAQVTADLNAVCDHALKIPACNGKLTVGGFCWGGGQTFRFATDRKDLKAGFVFYGSFAQNKDNLAKINCPIYGFYGENDARINATIPDSQKLMKELMKTYEPVTYAGAGHGFMRAGEEPAAKGSANAKGRDEAWERWKAILKKI
ncbi:MAG TPA: dienelactone hydrolase family protein [Gemmataceae bacterium]|nr:dienelactone hydrolase family protein [Gemmataceae bacterium]